MTPCHVKLAHTALARRGVGPGEAAPGPRRLHQAGAPVDRSAGAGGQVARPLRRPDG